MPEGITNANYKSGDIVMVIFHHSDAISNRVSSDANSVWFDIPEELEQYTGAPFTLDARKPEVVQIMKQFKVTKLPAIVFLEKIEPIGSKGWKILQILEGDIPKAHIFATYYRNIKKIYGEGSNFTAIEEKMKDDGLIPVDFKLDIFSFLDSELMSQIKKITFIGLSAFLAYQAVNTNSNLKRIAYGSGAALAASPFYRKYLFGSYRKYYPPS